MLYLGGTAVHMVAVTASAWLTSPVAELASTPHRYLRAEREHGLLAFTLRRQNALTAYRTSNGRRYKTALFKRYRAHTATHSGSRLPLGAAACAYL